MTGLVAGVDSSTQSCKVVIRDAESGALVRSGSAPHPDGTEVHPAAWWDALCQAVAAAGGLGDVAALSIAAQQHGMVALDADGSVVRPALLWNDTRSAGAAAQLVDELGRDAVEPTAGSASEPTAGMPTASGRPAGATAAPDQAAELGAKAWADAVGTVPVASFTVTKLRWLAEHEPDKAARVAAVCLPHDWLTWRLTDGRDINTLTTDRSDASGTGYWSPATGEYRPDLLQRAFGRAPLVPRVLAPAERAGVLEPTGFAAAGLLNAGSARARLGLAETDPLLLAAGAGDNAAAALGLGARPGDVVVSIGTSGTVFAVCDTPTADPTGTVAGFADATGRYLPLVCTLNAARVLDAGRALLGVSPGELSRLALSAPPGADGLTLIPYLEGERTPNCPDASGELHGLRLANSTPAHLARAYVEGMLCGLADGLDALTALGITGRVILIGGGARSEAVRAIAPAILGRPVLVPAPAEYVANGAAVQAAWAITGGDEPPRWEAADTELHEDQPLPWLRERYREYRDRAA